MQRHNAIKCIKTCLLKYDLKLKQYWSINRYCYPLFDLLALKSNRFTPFSIFYCKLYEILIKSIIYKGKLINFHMSNITYSEIIIFIRENQLFLSLFVIFDSLYSKPHTARIPITRQLPPITRIFQYIFKFSHVTRFRGLSFKNLL